MKKCSILIIVLAAMLIVFVSSACAQASPAGVELVHEIRGERLDLIHHGHIVIVDENSNVIFYVGDPEAVVFYRSIAKPIQALPTLRHNLDIQYGLTDEEIVIFSASHSGEPFHIAALESITSKAGLTEDMFIMNPTAPGNRQADIDRIAAGFPTRRFFHTCSGKHSSLLLLQRHLGGVVTDYWKPGSLADLEVIEAMKIASETDNFEFGVDGCGVPVFAAPLKNIAITFKNFIRPHKMRCEDLAKAAERYMPLIHRYPHMIGGNWPLGIICTFLNSDPNIVAKSGANAAYAFALKEEGLGVAIKVTDGADRVLPLIVMEILRGLGKLSPETEARLMQLRPNVIINDNDLVVGRRVAVFDIPSR